MVDKDLLSLVENMEIIGNIPILAFRDWDVIIKCEPGFVERQKHRLFIHRNKVEIEAVAQFLHSLRRQTAKEHRIWRYIEKVLPEIVDDIDALI